MTSREKSLLLETLELLRSTAAELPDFKGNDWKDVDDWIFSKLHFTGQELEDLYAGSGKLIDTGSAIEGAPPIGLTFQELIPYFGLPLHCVEGPNSIVQVIAEDVPGKPVLFTNGDIPELGVDDYQYIGMWMSLHFTPHRKPEEAFACLETEDGYILHVVKAAGN